MPEDLSLAVWNPADHPRDLLGRFRDKDGFLGFLGDLISFHPDDPKPHEPDLLSRDLKREIAHRLARSERDLLSFHPDDPRPDQPDLLGREAKGALAKRLRDRAAPPRPWQERLDNRKGRDLRGLPGPLHVKGQGKVEWHSNRDLQALASEYDRRHPHRTAPSPRDYAPVKESVGQRIADAYEQMEHNPNDPEVQRAYRALKRETLMQYMLLKEKGYVFEFYPEGEDPYPNSPREAIFDLVTNKRMFVYPTEDGFGTDAEFDPSGNPLLERVPGEEWGGRPVTYNDVFRAVHDVFGHGKEGVGFRARGEDNAYRQHWAMFSPEARKALATETRGQNSWLNFGPHGEHNRTASTADTIFADQKVGILPAWARDPDIHKEETP